MALPLLRAAASPRRSPLRPPAVVLDFHTRTRIDDLRPGAIVVLHIDAPDPTAVVVAVTGPGGGGAFRVGPRLSGHHDRVVITADAPGLARVAVSIHGRRLLDERLVCRGPSDELAHRCARAAVLHEARMGALESLAVALPLEVARARHVVEEGLRAHLPDPAPLDRAREVEVVVAASSPAAAGALRALWERIARRQVATRALAVLAGPEPWSGRPAAVAAPASLEALRDQIVAATGRERVQVAMLLAAWRPAPGPLTARAPDLELAAALGAAGPDLPDLPDRDALIRAYWRAWLLEHAVAIRPGPTGPRASGRLGRALFAELARAWSPGWVAAIEAELATAVVAAGMVDVL